MSFDVNVLSSKPVIRETANMHNDGGGGNLGYMEQGNQKKKEHKEELNIFAQKPQTDTFIMSGKLELPEDEFSLSGWIAEILTVIKKLFVKS